MNNANFIYNGTAHDVNVYAANQVTYVPEKRKFVVNAGEKPVKTYPKQEMLNATFDEVAVGIVDGVPMKKSKVVEVSDFPAGYDYLIVSVPYGNGVKKLGHSVEKLLGVTDLVYDETGKIVGCLSFSLF